MYGLGRSGYAIDSAVPRALRYFNWNLCYEAVVIKAVQAEFE